MNTKKIIIIAVIFHLFLAVLLYYLLFIYEKNPKIEKNIVKITKEAELIKGYENEISINNPNPNKNISSGFFVNKNTIITVSHGVDNINSKYKITDIFNKEYEANLIENDTENDIAYLKIKEDYKDFTKYKNAENIKINDEVCAINYSLEKKCGKIEKTKDKKISSNIIFEEGDSGGILIDNKNKIIGINIELDLENNYGISYIFN